MFIYMYVVLFGSSLFYVAFIFLWAIIATSGAIEWYFPISLLFLSPPNSTAVMLGFYGICVTKHSKLMEEKVIVRRVENAFLWFFWVPGIHVPFVLFIFLMIIFYFFWFRGAKTIKLQSNVSMDLISIKWTIKIQ